MAVTDSGVFQTWLFLGPETGEKQDAIDALREKLTAANAGSPPEETVYYAGETPVPVMVDALRNGSLFAGTRLFFIKAAEGIGNGKDADLLASYIASPQEGTSLVLISDETKAARVIEKAVPPANKRIFWELLEDRKAGWVQAFFRNGGFRISREGVDTILELVENNTSALRQECSRLTLFLDKSKEITGEDAEKWLSHTREETAFTLFSRIAAGDFSRSLESVRMLLAAKTAPQAIFATLASCFRKLAAYLALKEAGTGGDAEYRKIGIVHPGAKRDYASAGRLYSPAGAETCLALTAEYDILVRGAGSFPGQILMDQYLYKIHSLILHQGAAPAGIPRPAPTSK